jgi:hypothetical protein
LFDSGVHRQEHAGNESRVSHAVVTIQKRGELADAVEGDLALQFHRSLDDKPFETVGHAVELSGRCLDRVVKDREHCGRGRGDRHQRADLGANIGRGSGQAFAGQAPLRIVKPFLIRFRKR